MYFTGELKKSLSLIVGYIYIGIKTACDALFFVQFYVHASEAF